MENQFFSPLAKHRLQSLFPKDGADRFARLNAFFAIASNHPQIEMVVPAEIDQDLHEVLCARDEQGQGFEKFRMAHETRVELNSLGRSLEDLTDELSMQTKTLLEKHGWKKMTAPYSAHACTVKLLVS